MTTTISAARRRSADSIAKALLELLHEKGFADVTVSELCERAGVTRRTFYRCFDGKLDAVVYILDNVYGDVQKRFDITGSTVRRVFEFCYEYLVANIESAALFTDPALDAAVTSRIECYVEQSFNDELHNSVSFDPTLADYYDRFIAVGIVSVVRTWIRNGCKQSPATVAMLTEHLLSGVIA